MSQPVLQRIQADQSTEFNGMEVSFGIAPILATISDMFNEPHKPSIDAFVINVETIIRDRMKTVTKDTVLNMIADKVISDIITMIHYISAYNHASEDNSRTKPHIFVYIADYPKGIPEAYQREKFPKYTEERWHVLTLIVRKLRRSSPMGSCGGTVVKWCMEGSSRGFPHIELLKDISACMDIKYMNAYMVSHAPIDFHIYRDFKEFSIIESYTGKRKQVADLGAKVFGDENVPFNKYTHLLFGDKWLIKSPLKTAEKNRIKELAATKRWSMKPDMLILKDIQQSGIINISYLTKPKI